MTPATRRRLRVLGLGVALLLVVLALYPGTLASPSLSPHESVQYSHAVEPESSERYAEWTEEVDLDTYAYEDLSPPARELFDRTRAAEPSQYGWKYTYTPRVCRDAVLVCDGFFRHELPAEFTYGEELTPQEALVIVEDGDDRYLLKTGQFGHGDRFGPPVRQVGVWLTVFPLALFVGVVAVSAASDRVLVGTVGWGVLVATLAVLAPYLEMIGAMSARLLGVLLVMTVWAGVLAAAGSWIHGSVTGGDRSDGP